jgi:hypothetical protein
MDMITYPVLFSNLFLFVTLPVGTVLRLRAYALISFKIPLKLPEELEM